MLKLDLPRLERDGALEIEGEIPSDDPLWEGTELRLSGPLKVAGTARPAGSGEVLVDVRIKGDVQQECRRCLAEVVTPVDLSPMMVFGEVDDEAGDDGEVRPLDLDAAELSIGEAVREEVILAVDPFVVCDPGCKGLCPVCGVDRNKESCECVLEEPDPRWDELRALKSE